MADAQRQTLFEMVRERTSMAPLPWSFTRRMDSQRIEDANGNLILDCSGAHGPSGCPGITTDDAEFLCAMVNAMGRLFGFLEDR